MANDIQQPNSSSTLIKHHTIVAKTPGKLTYGYVTKDSAVKNTPVIADIQDKYNNRFKDI